MIFGLLAVSIPPYGLQLSRKLTTIKKRKLRDHIYIYVFFFSALKDLNGSVALSEVQIKCGICSKSYACRHTDRTFNEKVSYFKASK